MRIKVDVSATVYVGEYYVEVDDAEWAAASAKGDNSLKFHLAEVAIAADPPDFSTDSFDADYETYSFEEVGDAADE